jgi:hypothetical protein
MPMPRPHKSLGRRPRSVPALLTALAVALAAPAGAEYRPVGAAPLSVAPQHTLPPLWQADALVDGGGRPIILTHGPIYILPAPVPTGLIPTPAGLPDLPLACITLVPVRHGAVRLVEAQCLWEAGVEPRALPARCAVVVPVRGGAVHGFDPLCLGDAGYRLAGR